MNEWGRTNNGSVYLYATSVVSRAESDARVFPAKYHLVKMITPPSNDRVGVTCLSICPQQKRLVVGTMRGVVYGIQLSDYNKIGEKVEFSHDFHAVRPLPPPCRPRNAASVLILFAFRCAGLPDHVLLVGQARSATLLSVQWRLCLPDRAACWRVGDLWQRRHGVTAEGGDRHCAGALLICSPFTANMVQLTPLCSWTWQDTGERTSCSCRPSCAYCCST